MKTKNIAIFIIGNGGTGKTTLATNLNRQLSNSLLIPEAQTNSFYSLFHKDKSSWSFTCQLNYLWDYIQNYETYKQNLRFHIFDSGAWSNTEIYVKALYEKGSLNKAEFNFYQKIADRLLKYSSYPLPQLILHLTAPPQICHQRMQKRVGKTQLISSISYLNKLEPYYNRLTQKLKKQSIPVISINTENTDLRKKINLIPLVKQIENIFA
jgi:deoxyadenosine/deoxycytidine kinase